MLGNSCSINEMIQSADKSGNGAQVNMNCSSLVSPPSINNAFKADRPKGEKVPQIDLQSTKSFATGRFHGYKVNCQSQHKSSTDKVTISNAFSASVQNPVTCSGSCDMNSKDGNAITSSEASTMEKAEKRRTKRKKRRVKQKSNFFSHAGSTNPQGQHHTAHRNSTSEICGNNDHGNKLVSGTPSPEVSSSDGSINNIDLDGSIREIRCHRVITPCLSNNDDVSVQKNITGSTSTSFPRKHCATNSELATQENDEEYSSLVGSMEVAHHMKMHCQDIHSNNLLDGPDSLLLDSVFIFSNSDDSINTENDIRTFDIDCSTVGTSEASELVAGNNYLSHGCSVKKVAHTSCHCESRKNGIQDSSSGDIQYLVPGKRTKQIKTLPKSSKVHTTVDNGKLHNRVGKEINHSVWQKVQKIHVDECNCVMKKPPIRTQYKIRFKEVSPSKTKGKVVDINASLGNEIKKHSMDVVTKRLERKCAWCLKRDQDCCNQGGSQPGKDHLSASAMLSMQRKEMPKFAAQENNRVKGIPGSHSPQGSTRALLQNSGLTCSDSESVLGLQGVADASEPLESDCGTLLDLEIGHVENQDSSLLKLDDTWDQNLPKVLPPFHLPHLSGDEVAQTENVTSPVAGKQNHGSGSVLQKWVPVATKLPELIKCGRTKTSSIDQCDSTTGEGGALKKTSEENVSCTSQDSSTCSIEPAAADESLCLHEVKKTKHSISNVEQYDRHVSAGCLSCGSKRQNVSAGAKSNKIIQAVNDAYRIQLEAEAVRMITGNPIAEFERILHLSSPVICKSPNSICNHCSQNQIVGMSLCRHETPGIKLGCLWKWYEKHGSFGLEVRAEDYVNSKRLGVDQFAFRAYFVPFLSAIQLFKNHIDHSTKNENEFSVPVDSEECELCATSEKFDVGFHPAYPATDHHLTATQSVHSMWSNDLELLFEFFESDQPQKRRPLYEKIQELVKGYGSSTSKMFGDPTDLVSLNLHDLHPASWYSVAWYPIYKIPDGNLRAAFLTYHSLSHLVRRSNQSDSTGIDACVVSPVVGLQSYNAQGECWFRLGRGVMSQTEQIPRSLNPHQILKERLKTLEVTASLMARAMVNKGDQTSVNIHPDYEFFLSRRRY